MTSPKEFDLLVRNFSAYLSASWRYVEVIAPLTTTGSYTDDWMQANWECLVEGAINPPGEVFLQVYGAGADCNGRSSRVYLPDIINTHVVICTSSNSVVEDVLHKEKFDLGRGMELEEFVSFNGSWYSKEAPFNYVLLDDNGLYRAVSVDELFFRLKEIHEI